MKIKHIEVILLAIKTFILFNNTFLCIWGDIFGFNREILQNKHFQYFDRYKARHDRAKIGLAGQHDRPPFKNYFEPWSL